MSLPVDAIEARLAAQLSRGPHVVICAPPGSGKTTRVPPMLVRAGLEGQVLVLQPRRLATRLVAQRVAAEAGEPVGRSVGYQTRHERVISDATRICFLTEGLLLRRLLATPTLPGVAAVVLDEFHERSLTLDITLGLLKQLVATRRPELRVVVMSATLDARNVCDYLGAPLIEASGRSYPVDVSYLSTRTVRPVWDVAAEEVRRVITGTDDGDVLVFMPGVYEINRTITACRRALGSATHDVTLLPLHGSLPPAQQDAAVAPSKGGDRKVIVSTNVAETSITIDGVRHVIDSGLARTPRYDARRGLNVLLASSISRASADQRAGRAGRTAPGSCVRLWTEGDHRGRAAHDMPEVCRLDLTEAVLQLRAMGVDDPAAFDWLDAPSPDAVDHATSLLTRLEAIDRAGKLTPLGETMASFPLHPRLSRMLVESIRRGCTSRGCLWAALASDRPILTRHIEPDDATVDYSIQSDLIVMERAFESARAGGFRREACERAHVHSQACREVDQVRRQLESAARRIARAERHTAHETTGDIDIDLIKCLLAAFPDHVALRPDAQKPTCAMIGRRRVVVDRHSAMQSPGLLLALDVREVGQGDAVRTVLSMISRIEPDWLREVHRDLVTITKKPVWNDELLAVEMAEQHAFGGLVYQETRRNEADADISGGMLVDYLLSRELRPLKRWDDAVDQWLARARCVAQWSPQRGLIQYDDDDLRLVLHEIVAGATRLSQVRDRDCLHVVMNAMSWDDQQFVERMAPTTLPLPSGAKLKLTYQSGSAPRGRAKIQELYDLAQTPTVAGGRQRVLLEILGPNYRPVQITDDLTSFWQTTYPQLKKELKRRYPKHEWR